MEKELKKIFDNTMAELKISPCPAARPRVTRWATFYPKKYEKFRTECKAILSDFSFNRKEGVPLLAVQTFYIPFPKSYSKKKRDLLAGTYCTDKSKGDLDNHEKSLWDSLNEKAFEDDSDIAVSVSRKMWTSGEGRIEFSIFRLYK